MKYVERLERLLEKIKTAIKDIDTQKIDSFSEAVLSAQRVFVVGGGRSGLMGSSFVMRLVQSGIQAHKVDSIDAPSISPRDLLIAISGSGGTGLTLHYVKIAKDIGTKVVCITANPDGKIPLKSDLVIKLNAKTKFEQGEFPLGTVFEDSTLIFLDMIIENIREKREISERKLLKRHNSFN